MRRAQAQKNGRTVSQRLVGCYNDCVASIGFEYTALLIAVLFVCLTGGLNHVLGSADETKAEQVSNIPDHISADCHAKLVRSYLRETSVERYERQEMENALKSGDNCQQQR